MNWVCDNWNTTDEGIWEVRGGAKHFTYSKVMCWVALDRGIRLARKRSFPCDLARWISVRDELYNSIQTNGWSEQHQAYVQSYESGDGELDASVLIMSMVFFCSPMDPRLVKTVDAIKRSVKDGGLVMNSLVYRYVSDDGIQGGEGTFSICTFWLAEVLATIGKHDPSYLEEGRWLFEQMLGYSNHVGLYSEEIGSTGESLGNFPQAFTHLALISAALHLNASLG